MSTCDWCGTEIRFILISETATRKTWSAPMDSVSRKVVNEGGFGGLRVTEHLTVHDCQEKREAQEAAKAAVRERSGRVAEMMQARAEYELLVKEALTRICPSCKAGIGEACINLTKIKNGERVPTAGPHPKRLVSPGTSTTQGEPE